MTQDHRLDLQRRQLLGMVEAIWGEHKSADLIARIISALHEAGELALATRVEPSKAEAVIAALAPLPKATLQLVHHLEALYLNGRGVARSRSRPRPHGDPGGRQ